MTESLGGAEVLVPRRTVYGMDPRVGRLVKAAGQSFDASEEAVFGVDATGRRVYSNPAFDRLVGWEGRELEGRRPPFPYWDGDATPRMLAQLAAMLDGRMERLGVRAVQGRFVHRDGGAFDVILTGHQIGDVTGETLLNLCFAKAIAPDDTVGVTRWLSRTLALQRFADAVMRLDGAMDTLAERPAPALRAPVTRVERLPGYASLTPREREVLIRVVEGLRVTHVAEDLAIQPATVRNHLKAIFRKTGLRSQAQLVDTARRLAAGEELS